jgi:DNA-binding response OmpR family regulator
MYGLQSQTTIDQKKPKVFYVEDEENISGMVREMLTRQGFQVQHSASFGDKVPDFEGIDLFLLDYACPGGNGIDFARELVDEGYQGKIVICSGSSYRLLLEHLERSGLTERVAFMPKPFSLEELYSHTNIS